MLLYRSGIRVSSFLRFSASTKSTHPKFYSSFWPLLCSSNCRQAKQTFTNFHGLNMKQYFCSRSNATGVDVTMETANRTGTAVDEQQQEQNGRSVEKLLAKKSLRSQGLEGAPSKVFSLVLKQGRSGVKFFQFVTLLDGRFFNSPKYQMPVEAYPFVRAMDELFGYLATTEDQKLPISSERGFHVLFSTSSPGILYDHKLDLELENNGRFTVNLGTRRTGAKPDHVESRKFWLSVREFHWLRHEIGHMLAEFDGSQPVDEPPKYPGWLIMDSRPRSALALARPNPPRQPKEQQQRPQMDESSGGGLKLAKKLLPSRGAGGAPKSLIVELCQGQSGAKYFKCASLIKGSFFNFPNVMVPEDAYQFIQAMDVLLEKLGTTEGQNLLSSTESRLMFSTSSPGQNLFSTSSPGQNLFSTSSPGQNLFSTSSPGQNLFSTSSPGQNYDYKMDLQWTNGGRFTVQLSTCRTEASKPEQREKTFWLNLKEFHWLRHQMGDLLSEFDGTQIVDEPPKYPGWLRMDGRPRSALALARPSPNRLVPWLQQSQRQPNANADVNLTLLQVQLLSQSRQIEQLQQQVSSIAQPVLPDHVPSVLPELAENAIGGREWNEMANVLAQAIQTQMGHVPAGNGQPVPASLPLAQQQQQRKWPDDSDLSGWNCEEDGEEDDQQGQ